MVTLSASRIKTFYSCSYLYWAKYIAKLPDPSNAGAAVGSAVHDLSEIVFSKENKYKNFVNEAIKNNKLSRGAKRYLANHLKKAGFLSIENVDKAERFVLVAFQNDFWLEGAAVRKQPEEEFLIGTNFKLKGFIDKYGLYKDETGDWLCKLFDYKSQRAKFSSKEMDFNIQALSYLLSVKTAHPEINLLKSSVKFILLAFPEDPIQEFKIKDLSQVAGFEMYLENTQETIDNFKDESRFDDPAFDRGYPAADEGFGGKIMCGRAKFPGELKKNGDKMWHCVYKFGFDYWAVLDKTGKIVKSSFTEIAPKEGQTVEKRKYNGCEACVSKFKSSPKPSNNDDFI